MDSGDLLHRQGSFFREQHNHIGIAMASLSLLASTLRLSIANFLPTVNDETTTLAVRTAPAMPPELRPLRAYELVSSGWQEATQCVLVDIMLMLALSGR
jgi:hypothetical protein